MNKLLSVNHLSKVYYNKKDEIEATSHLKLEGIDKVFILHDLYSIEETKRIKAKVKEIIDNK